MLIMHFVLLGECWSGNESEIHYNRDGKSDRCWAENYKPCPYNSYHCVGRDMANRVYNLKTGTKSYPLVEHLSV